MTTGKKLTLVTLPCLALAGWIAVSMAQAADPTPPASPNPEIEARVDPSVSEISKRVGMAASFEVMNVDGIDPIEEAASKGWIIDVTLEEVEEAVKKAEVTPGREDDLAALRLLHRGSYRFYPSDKQSGSGNIRAKAQP